VKVTEKENWEEKKKNTNPAKRGVRKKERNNGHIGTRGVRPLRHSQLSLRPALWTISTSGKPLHAHRWTTSPLYRNMEFQPVVEKNNKQVLLMVLRYCPDSTATR
jgi:hypothetical protein